MPFRLTDERSKIQFTSSAAMPHMIYQACLRTGTISNTVYCQHAIAEALARDLGIDIEEILADLPPPRGPAAHVYDRREGTMNRYAVTEDHSGGRSLIGPANTIEEVR